MAAVVTSGSGKSVGEDAAAEVGPEVPLDPDRNAVAERVGLCGLGEEGLEVMLDDGVERRGGGLARAVDGPRGGRVRPAGEPPWGPEDALRRGRHAGACRGERAAAMDSWARLRIIPAKAEGVADW